MERRFVLKDNGLQIPCVLDEPEYCTVRRCIIGVHGFCGHKDSKVLVDIAEEMGLFGAATVRFDFPAHGDSPVTDWELSLEQCQKTLAAVVRWAKRAYPYVDIGIFATGFGAFVTLVALDELREIQENLKLVLQTPDLNMSLTLLSMTQMTEEQLHKAGRVVIGATHARAVEVSYSFYEELQKQMVYYNHQMPMLLLHGELDDVVPLQYLDPFRRFNPDSRLVVIPGADHQFRGEGQWDMVVDLTRDWFQCEQVLLCDYI